jgi:integrase
MATAADDRRIRRNPCRIKGAGQEHSEERPVIPVATLVELLDNVPARYRALLLLATFANLRCGELAGLRRNQLDLDACEVHVWASTWEMDDGRLIDGGPKSRAGSRSVAFPQQIVPELRDHLEHFAQPGAVGLVFIGPKGGQLRRSNFCKFWHAARDAVGLPGLHFHDLRHTGNTMAAAQGATLRELMERMGHSSTRAALIYLHATRGRDKRIAAGMGKLFRDATKPKGSGTQHAASGATPCD